MASKKFRFEQTEDGQDILIEMKNDQSYPAGATFSPVYKEGLLVGYVFRHIRNHERLNTTIPEQMLVFRGNTDAKLIISSTQVGKSLKKISHHL